MDFAYRIVPALGFVAFAACTSVSTDDGGSAPEPVACDVSVMPLELDDASLGFSPAEVLARFGGVHMATLEYYKAGTTELTLELKLAGAVERVTTSIPAGVDPDELVGPCDESTMRLPVELRFITADGQFDERIPATWEMSELLEYESVNEYLDIKDVRGSFTADADELSFVINFAEGEPHGEVIGVVAPADDLGSEFNIARFNQDSWPQTE